MKSIRNGLWVAVLAVLFNVAYAQQSMTVNIDSQPLVDALNQFANQTGLQVLVNTDEVQASKLMAPRVSGLLTADDALRQLLSGSELKYEFINERTVRVSKAKTVGDARASGERALGDGMRLARTEGQQGTTSGSSSSAGAPSEESPAQQKADSDTKIEEIVVSAQKRLERLQDVPISISVMSGRDLDRSTGGGVIDALNHVPGVTASILPQLGGAFIALRGVSAGANTGAGGPTSGYYLDAAPWQAPTAPDTNVYDLDRVEVLRGPQGTLYGVNSVSGVVRILTNDVNLDRFEAKGRLTTSSTSGGGTNYRGDGAINVPLVEGKLGLRAVGGYEDVSGWVDRPNKNDINSGVLRNVRAKLGASPVDKLKVGLSVWHTDAKYDATPAANAAGTRNFLFDEPLSIDTDLYALALSYDFSDFSLSSNSAKLKRDIEGLKRSIFSGNVQNTFLDDSVFSQEINLISTGDSPLRWSVGAIYSKFEIITRVKNAPLANIPTASFIVNSINESKSAAVFGQASYRFVNDLELMLGLRYFRDDVSIIDFLSGRPDDASFHATTPRVGLTWYPSKDLTAYVSYAQGFRSGSLQTPGAAAQFPDAEPDRLHNYEVGAKGNLFAGRLSFDTALYYMKWDDVQQGLSVPLGATFTGAVVNGSSASGLGFEMSADFQPVDRLNLGLTFGWNDLTFDENVLSSGIVLFSKGSRINTSGEYSYGASLDYTFPLAGLEARFSASANYQSELVSRFLIGNVLTIAGDPITIARAGLSVGPENSGWSVGLFVDNLTNEDGATLGGWPPPGQIDEGTHLRPRTIGAQFEYQF